MLTLKVYVYIKYNKKLSYRSETAHCRLGQF